MSRLNFLLLTGLLIAGQSFAGELAAADKVPTIGNFPFWTAPKREHADQFVPGLNAALLLTPEQIGRLHAARSETIDNESLREATRKDPNATDAQREAANRKLSEAQADLRVRASNILTAEQRSVIEKANAAYTEVQHAVLQEFQPRFAAAKGDGQATEAVQKELKDRFAAEFVRKLDGILSADQKLAMERAAAKEREAELNVKKK
jgi:hypothetical protein